METRWRNNCCRGKAISMTYSECVCSLIYLAYKAHVPFYVAICGLSGSTIFLRIIIKAAQFEGEGY
jgi:cytochrome c oxidase assembly protein Cox11